MSSEILLGVNIDHVATIRQARGTRYPEPAQAALIAEQAGADGITLHLREDRRHIQDRDVEIMIDMLQSRMNLEMAVTDEMLTIASRIKPHGCCLVPESREELTTEGGLDVAGQPDKIKDACTRLADVGVRVSLFIDAEEKQLEAAVESGAPVIEIHTGHYADAPLGTERDQQLQKIIHAVEYGESIGLQVNAGHGLDYHNVRAIAGIPGIKELNIGHSVIARAVFYGMYDAVAELKAIMLEARG